MTAAILDTRASLLDKQTLSQVKATLKRGEQWVGYLCPSKCSPSEQYPYNFSMLCTFSPDDSSPDPGHQIGRFDAFVNSFAYHQCSSQLGKTVHFYRIL
jgi:hypothetical protein